MSSTRNTLNLFDIDHRSFELMVADLLNAGGRLHNVQVQPATTPTFDIIAREYLDTALGKRLELGVGVQVKQQRQTLGKDVLDGVPTEATKLNIQRVLLVSATDFRPSLVEHARTIENKGWLLNIALWNERDLRLELARRPHVLRKYFGLDITRELHLLKTADGGKRVSAQRLLSRIKDVCCIPHLDLWDLLSIDLLAARSDAMQLTGPALSQHELLDRYIGVVRDASLQSDLATPNPAYDSYRYLEHFTVLGHPPENIPSRVPPIDLLTDRVEYGTTLLTPKPFVFNFTNREAEWARSHSVEHNEYTWRYPREIGDLKKLAPFIDVVNMRVNDVHLKVTSRIVTSHRIRIEMSAPKLASLRHRHVFVSYVVKNVFPSEQRTLMSSLHAPAGRYKFTLARIPGFPSVPRVHSLIGTFEHSHVVHDSEAVIPSVSFRAEGVVRRGTGIVINW